MIFQLIILSCLMFFVANVQEYDIDSYNCEHHSILLVDLLREYGFEAYMRSGYVDWDRYENQEEIDRLITTQNISIGDHKCCHAWVEVVMFGKNWTIEATTGHIANSSLYIRRNT